MSDLSSVRNGVDGSLTVIVAENASGRACKGGGGSNAASYLADPTSPIPSHCAIIILFKSASIVVTSTLRVNLSCNAAVDVTCDPVLCSKLTADVK